MFIKYHAGHQAILALAAWQRPAVAFLRGNTVTAVTAALHSIGRYVRFQLFETNVGYGEVVGISGNPVSPGTEYNGEIGWEGMLAYSLINSYLLVKQRKFVSGSTSATCTIISRYALSGISPEECQRKNREQ